MPADRPQTKEQREAIGVGFDELVALLCLDQVRGFGPGAFRAAHEAGVRPEGLLEDASRLPLEGKRAEKVQKGIAGLGSSERELARSRAVRQLERAAELGVQILTYRHPDYPPNLLASNNAVPILYASGDLEQLKKSEVIACVGSRKIRPPYIEQLRAFSELAAKAGWVVASGFAIGADTAAHQAAVAAGGATVLVMPSGLDIPFPPENRELWKQWQGRSGVAAISEFPLGTMASALTLRKRNKTIVGISRAVLVAQSSVEGGTMNAYRFALEQGKQVLSFAPDGKPDSDGNRLIQEQLNGQASLLTEGALPRSEFEDWLAQSCS